MYFDPKMLPNLIDNYKHTTDVKDDIDVQIDKLQ